MRRVIGWPRSARGQTGYPTEWREDRADDISPLEWGKDQSATDLSWDGRSTPTYCNRWVLGAMPAGSAWHVRPRIDMPTQSCGHGNHHFAIDRRPGRNGPRLPLSLFFSGHLGGGDERQTRGDAHL